MAEAGTPTTRCRSCNAEVWWSETPGGKRAPFNADGANHFSTCPDRREWRKQPAANSEPEPEQMALPFASPEGSLDVPERPAESRYPR